MKFSIAYDSHPGLVRELNEDTVFGRQRSAELGTPLALLIVADGMGGHQAGDVASQIAVKTVNERLGYLLERHATEDTQPVSQLMASPESQIERLTTRLRLAVEAANLAVFEYGQANPDTAHNLGTTITCALLLEMDDGKATAIIANVGDSRAYHYQGQAQVDKGRLTAVTEDHSYVAHLVRAGELDAADIFDHPQRSMITRALGNEAEVKVDVVTHALIAGDQLLLCSDGLWEMVRDTQQITAFLEKAVMPAQAVADLIAQANEMGGEDNISVALVTLE